MVELPITEILTVGLEEAHRVGVPVETDLSLAWITQISAPCLLLIHDMSKENGLSCSCVRHER